MSFLAKQLFSDLDYKENRYAKWCPSNIILFKMTKNLKYTKMIF